MAMSKLNAWTIFKANVEGKIEGQQALDALVGDEAAEYAEHIDQFQFDIAAHGVNAQNEAASLLTANPELKERLETTLAHEYTADDYRQLVTVFEGSKYEKLHLTAFFRVENTALLLDLVKPAA